MRKKPGRRASLAWILIAVTAAGFAPQAVAQSPSKSRQAGIRGFTSESAARQRKLEADFQRLLSPSQTRRFHRYLTAEPHPAGSRRNNDLAHYVADLWRKQGLEEVTIHRYDVLNTFPREVAVEMVSPIRYKASLREDGYAVDPDTSNPRVQSGYTGLSASGDVTAELVYAFSGNPADYDLLKEKGIDVRGKIVIVRYSNPYSYRGFKALTAQNRGAAAIIIYSDPAEDGYRKGKVFPDGPWGPASHIQRGAITYDFMVPGDPLTPGWPSTEGARRLPPEQAVSLPKIVAVPMSWRDAKPLLENMNGPEAPGSWQGGMPIKYRLTGAVRVRVKVDMDNSVKPNYVVEARIRGSEHPDDWIILGNHRDAWEFGAVDPSSGTASMLDLTHALGVLKKRGIRPRRTLVFCSWDGEEVGLTGSTEWGEHFADGLKKKAVAYLNVDSSASGPRFSPDAVASLAPLIVEVSRDLKLHSGRTLYFDLRSHITAERAGLKLSGPVTDSMLVDTKIGSGSDHTVFLNHLGIPTIGLTFEGPYGVYHSIYDNFYWMNRFGDPGYRYHVLCSKVWGLIALRLSNAEVLPFDFASYAEGIRGFIADFTRIAGVASNLNLRDLVDKTAAFERAGRSLNQTVARRLASGPLSPEIARQVNEQIRDVERRWLDPSGLPGREWFKHILYAARFTYAHLELPGLTEAAERGDWTAAKAQLKILEDAIKANAVAVEKAASNLR